MSGAQGSFTREAAESGQKKSPAPRQNDLGTDLSSFKYGVLLVHNILQDCKYANLPDNPSKQSVSAFCVISRNHELVTKL